MPKLQDSNISHNIFMVWYFSTNFIDGSMGLSYFEWCELCESFLRKNYVSTLYYKEIIKKIKTCVKSTNIWMSIIMESILT